MPQRHVAPNLLASYEMTKDQESGIKTWSREKKYPCSMAGFASHGYFFPLLFQVSHGALLMPSCLKVGWQDTDFYAGLYGNQLSIKLFLLISTMFFHLCAWY